MSNIALGALAISADTTVSEFSAAVVSLNECFKYGDVLSFIAVLQRVNGEGIPKITSSFLKLELSRDDSRRLWAVMPDYAFVNIGGYLGTDADLAAGCYTWIHSRNDGKLLISSQVLVSNNDDMIAQYSSDAQYELARNSYGTNSGSFFSSSDSDGGSGQAQSGSGQAQSGNVTISLNVASGQSAMGAVCIDDNYFAQSDAKTVPSGTRVTIYAERNSDYLFDKWSDGNTDETRDITVDRNMSLTASFIPAE
ncbi:MAG: hypothetical protein MJY75_08070 [Bacteroidaceae bacterium]|nr:hypothetical protein [Bacteroidaceae bacterium]